MFNTEFILSHNKGTTRQKVPIFYLGPFRVIFDGFLILLRESWHWCRLTHLEVLIHFRKISKGKKSVEKNQIWLYLCKYRFWISFLTGSVYEYLANEQLVQKIITSENFEKKRGSYYEWWSWYESFGNQRQGRVVSKRIHKSNNLSPKIQIKLWLIFSSCKLYQNWAKLISCKFY